MLTATFLVTNLHCPSCVSVIQDIFGPRFPGIIGTVDISLIRQTIRCSFDDAVTGVTQITTALTEAAFDVQHVTVVDQHGAQVQEKDLVTHLHERRSRAWRKAQQTHIDNCDACQKENTSAGATTWRPKTWASLVRTRKISTSSTKIASPGTCEKNRAAQPHVVIVNDNEPTPGDGDRTFNVTVAIEGMTCSSCIASISHGLEDVPYVKSISIDLVGNSGFFAVTGRSNIDRLCEAIEDLGYGAEVISVAENSDSVYTVSVAIEGMTCSSCVGSITRGLENTSWVKNISIDLVNNSGNFTINGKDNVGLLEEAIEDLGYGAEIVSVAEVTPSSEPRKERVIDLEIEGMHCNNCPDRIMNALDSLQASHSNVSEPFKILQRPSMARPIVQIAYMPHAGDDLNIRSVISIINNVDPAFVVSVYHAPTLEERSRRLQRAERWFILYRLLFSFAVAIPTFIIGVVYMSLVSSHNATRTWFEEPIWGGNATRTEWALFIMTTPVMFFGADLFHRRAAKEIWHMWKPGSKFPWLRRFYRFGSMNLLVSAATMVAYVSSLAVLIANAVQAPNIHASTASTYFDAVTFLTFFILIGRYLEAYSKAKTGDAVTMLGQLKPKEALLAAQNGLPPQTIPVDQLEVDDIVMVQRGHSPPADGSVISEGVFSFDESSLTGESKPVSKKPGDTVYAGTVNIGDVVEIKVTEVGNTSMLDNIIAVVRSGQAKRAPIERFADLLTGYFTPMITLLALLTWIIWLALGLSGALPNAWLANTQGGWAFWSLEFAIAVFVIACPCGIGLAAPTALFVGGGIAAKQGILVQGGGQAFQEAAHVDAIVFDKTGTLTQGTMEVTECSSHSSIIDKPAALALASAMENRSTHPIAQAIVRHVATPEVSVTLGDISEIPGHGMTTRATVHYPTGDQSFDVAIGNEALLNKIAKDDDESKAPKLLGSDPHSSFRKSIQQHQMQGHSIAILAVRKSDTPTEPYSPVLLFAISDPLRPEATEVIESLRSRGIEVHMCTGDNPTTAAAIARQLSIPLSHVRPSALPQDKAEYIHALQQEPVTVSWSSNTHPSQSNNPQITITTTSPSPKPRRRIIAFAGDGLNDTPALTASDISISLSSGSDIAINASSFILLSNSSPLTSIPTLFALSRRVFTRVKLNFGWALVYNLVLIPVAAGVFFPIGMSSTHEGFRLGPVWASLAMACSSVSVVASSLALRLPEVTLEGMRRRGWMFLGSRRGADEELDEEKGL